MLPILSRLEAVLKMAQTDPAGNDYPAHSFVFGELGEQTKNISRAWRTCVLKGFGHEPGVASARATVTGVTGGAQSN